MYPSDPKTLRDEVRLGQLAMKFRSTRRKLERQGLADEYAETVARLIESGTWEEMPAPEDQLPDDWMPKAFFAYWLPDR
jgi:hypothetical protein